MQGSTNAAVTALAQLAPWRAIPPLLLSTQDNDPWVRGEAVAMFGKIGDVGILPHLRPLLADTDEEVREATGLTIAKLEKEKDESLPLVGQFRGILANLIRGFPLTHHLYRRPLLKPRPTLIHHLSTNGQASYDFDEIFRS